MANSIRVRTELKDDLTQVKLLIRHPMHTGMEEDKKTGKKIPAHFIKEVTCQHNSKTVFTALWGIAVAKNPYLSFTLPQVKAGDVLAVTWLDNQGQTDNKIVNL